MVNLLSIFRLRTIAYLLLGILSIWISASPTVTAITSSDIQSLIEQHPYYDPGASSACLTTGSVAGGSEALSKQSGLDPQWVDLINKDANKYGSDPLAMAAILYWENRGWPAFGRLVNGDAASGMGPWQFIGDTWANFSEYSADQVYDLIPSTDAAARYIKGLGGVAGSKAGSIDQDFGKGKNIPSMATVMKSYNAGGSTYRIPGIASHAQSGRQWGYDKDSAFFNWANRDSDKPEIIDDYIVAGTYLYYQIGSGTAITYKDTDSYVAEALTKQEEIKNFNGGGSGSVCDPSCTPGGNTNGKTVVIDPGHSGANTEEVDPASGIEAVESTNTATGERQNMWDTAQIMKSKLEKDGYQVTLTKNAEDDPAGLIEKARRANATNAAIAVSLHSTPGTFGTANDHWGVTPQEVGRFRQNWDDGKKKTFEDAQLAQTSQQYAQVIAEERTKLGDKANVAPLDASFTTDRVKAHGDISIVQLFGTIPWVYNEVGQTGFDQNKYAEGITNGIEKALGAVVATSASTLAPATTCGAVAGSIVQTAINYAWKKKNDPEYIPKEVYLVDSKKAKAEGKYTGADGGPNKDIPGIDCGGFTTRVMQNSGVDPQFGGGGNTDQQKIWMDQHPQKYQALGNSITSTDGIKAGDIAVNSNHTYIYLADAGTQSDPGWEGNAVSASIFGNTYPNGKAPAATGADFDNGGPYYWYRVL